LQETVISVLVSALVILMC